MTLAYEANRPTPGPLPGQVLESERFEVTFLGPGTPLRFDNFDRACEYAGIGSAATNAGAAVWELPESDPLPVPVAYAFEGHVYIKKGYKPK